MLPCGTPSRYHVYVVAPVEVFVKVSVAPGRYGPAGEVLKEACAAHCTRIVSENSAVHDGSPFDAVSVTT